MADEKKETIILDFQVDTKSAVTSIENLTKANKALREERKSLDLNTKEGADRVKEINAQLDKNTQTIKDNSSAIEKQRMNVGNYTSALDKLVPGLGGVVDGFMGMTKAALAFIATPIGLVIAAIGVAISAVIAYFKSSEEGQNKWNKVVLVGKTILESFKNILEAFGEAIVAAFENPQEALENFWKALKENVINRLIGLAELVPKIGEAISLVFEGEFAQAGKVAADAVLKVTLGVENATDKMIGFIQEVSAATEQAIADGQRLADIQAKIDADERKLIVERAKVDLEVSKLRQEAISQEGDQKRATIQEAIDLEEALSIKETQHAQDKLDQAQLELQANGDDKEAKLKVAEATAAVISAEASRYQATLRFSKEIEKLNDAEAAQVAKNLAAKQKAEEDYRVKSLKDVQSSEDQMTLILADANKRQADDIKKSADAETKVKEEVNKAELGGLNLLTKEKSVARIAGTVLLKADSLKEIVAQTSKGAISAYAALAGIPLVGPILGGVAAALVTAYGGARAAAVAGLSFATGGPINGPSHSGGGVDINAEGGEFVMRKSAVDKYGMSFMSSLNDGAMIANASTSGYSSSSQPPIKVDLVYKELREFGNRVELKESIVTA